MEPGLRIGTVRVRSGEPDSPALRLAVSARLGGADARPSGLLPPAAVLVVRSLADPLPGRLGGRPGVVRPDPLWERALRERLAGLARGAARPRRGWIPPGAEAVVFADEAELLACLALDLARGSAGRRWWWRAILRRLRSPGLGAVLVERARSVPAAFAALARWGEAAPVVRALDAAELARVGEALFRAHALSAEILAVPVEEAAASSRYESTLPDTSPALPPPFSPAPAPWRRWLPEAQAAGLSPEGERLLGVALMLSAAPARVRSRRFAVELRRWWQGARAADPEPGSARQYNGPPSGGGSSSPLGGGGWGRGEARRGADPIYRDARPSSFSEPAPLLTSPLPQPSPSQGGGTRPPDSVQPLDAEKVEPSFPGGAEASAPGFTVEEEPGRALLLPDPPQPTAFAEDGFLTRLGGVLYLINLIEHLDLLDRFEQEGETDLCGPWGFLEMLARALLGFLGSLAEEHEHDPLWPALAELDGRAPDDPLDPPLSPWLGTVLPDLQLRLGEALGVEPAQAAGILLCPGRIYVTSSHVDLVADLDAISLPVRRAGLDRDPGWLPRFGRVVLFHFE